MIYKLLIVLFSCICANGIYYPVYYLSDFCGENYGNSITLKSSGFSSVALIKGYSQENNIINGNCSIRIRSPESHNLGLNLKELKINNTNAQLDIKLDNATIISLFNESTYDWVGDSEIVIIIKPTAPGKTLIEDNLLLQFVVTAFVPYDGTDSCPLLFYFDCGNKRCIREIHRCDDYNNCGNNKDETHCGDLPFLALLALDGVLVLLLGLGMFQFYRSVYGPPDKCECTCENSEKPSNSDKESLLGNDKSSRIKPAVIYQNLIGFNWYRKSFK